MTVLHDVELPALDGRDPLGFLAALGALRLLSTRPPVRLWWQPGPGTAVLTSELASIDEVEAALVDVARHQREDELLPGLPGSLVPKKRGSAGSDPARIGVERFREIVADPGFQPALAWIAALWTDLAGDEERCAWTPFNAPTGQQTFRSMFEIAAKPVADDPQRWLAEALRSWRRVLGYTGESLDSRAFRDAAEVVHAGQRQADRHLLSYGVPGATWLALNALPFFRMAGNGVLETGTSPRQVQTERSTVGWARRRSGSRSREVLVWPLWHTPLDEAAVSCLLDHPLVRTAGVAADDGAPRAGSRLDAQLRALGVWATVRCARRQGAAGKSQGVLTPERIRYTAPGG